MSIEANLAELNARFEAEWDAYAEKQQAKSTVFDDEVEREIKVGLFGSGPRLSWWRRCVGKLGMKLVRIASA